MQRPKLKRRERDTIIQALRAGVVPKLGLQHIHVGRVREVREMIRDIDRIIDGGSTIRIRFRKDLLSQLGTPHRAGEGYGRHVGRSRP